MKMLDNISGSESEDTPSVRSTVFETRLRSLGDCKEVYSISKASKC